MDCITKPIEGFPGYWVNSYGCVWSERSNKWLKPAPDGGGYLKVVLCRDGKSFNKKIHRLVAEAFVPNDDPETKDTVDHKDNDKLNNRADNLQWLSRGDNARKGNQKPLMLFDTLSGDVEQFDSQTEAAAFLGCSQQYMSKMTLKPQIEYLGWCVLATKDEGGEWAYNKDRLTLGTLLGLLALDDMEDKDDE